MRRPGNSGFSLVELIVALGVTLLVTAAIFDLVGQSRRHFDAEPAIADRQQRIRAAVDALFRDLLTATIVMPYRAAGAAPEPPGTFRDDVVTIVSQRPAGEDDVVRTYYVRAVGSASSQLMRAEGGGGDAPVIDGVTSLSLAYFGDPAAGVVDPAEACVGTTGGAVLVPMIESEFTDGPWCPAGAGADPFDADLLRIRKVSVRFRVAAQAEDVAFEVTPRNRNQGR